MDIGKCFRDAWGLFRLDLGPLALAAFIVAVVTGSARLVIGLFDGPGIGGWQDGWFFGGLSLFGGFATALVMSIVLVVVYAWFAATTLRIMMRRVRERRPAACADLADIGGVTTCMVAAVVLGVLLVVGYALFVVPGLVLMTIWLYALPLVVDRDAGLGEAMSASREMAVVSGCGRTFLVWICGAVAVGVVSGLLEIVPVAGWLLSVLVTPFAVAYVVSMYFQAIGQGARVDAALAAGRGAP